MKQKKPVASEETRKKLKEAFRKLQEDPSTPFSKSENQKQNQEDDNNEGK